jgi:hypothetical protein
MADYLKNFFEQNNELFNGVSAVERNWGHGEYAIAIKKKEHGSFILPIARQNTPAKPFMNRYIER